MSYKLGLLLSLVFLMAVFLFSGDMLCISAIRSDLDSIALTLSYRISLDGRVSEETKQWVKDCGANLSLPLQSPRIGDTYSFQVYKDYQPIIISSEAMRITVKRSTIVGYYQSLSGGRRWIDHV